MGLIPDLAVMRDRAKTQDSEIWLRPVRARLDRLDPALAQLRKGLSDSGRAFHAAGVLRAFHRVMDFSVSQLPGWHATIFPPYFVAGAVFCGFGMVLVLLIPLRKMCQLEDIITMAHMDIDVQSDCWLTGCIVGYIYVMEFFIAWYSGNPYERLRRSCHRMFGHHILVWRAGS